ncbi:MAG: S41 family peptidase [Cytophagales bacterium]|nr:S41 family peptidase [Cytophagales bacterium]
MRSVKLGLVVILLGILGVACKRLNISPLFETKVENSDVNNWIYAKMKEYYLWEDDMIDVTKTDLTLAPDDYFKSLLVEPGVVDRFSWIEESSEELRNSLNGITSTYGIKTQALRANNSQNVSRIILSVAYVVKNSVAERKGLKRGDIITKVNGQDLTNQNYNSALRDSESATVTLGTYNKGYIDDTEVTIEMTKEVTQSNALQHYSIIELANKKIGYFVYTQFLTSNDNDLNKMFGEFKSSGINELVVDLRFNPGGYISSAELLSSLIVKNLDENKVMTRQIWNAEQTEERIRQYGSGVFDTYFFKSRSGIGNINNLGNLDRVYFLVSNGSASASELLINNLKPFMEVILIGQHTYGKSVGSITIDDDQDPKRWSWGMQPIVLRSVNYLGEADYGTPDGFKPDIEVVDNIIPYKPFGDPDETYLFKALEDILGSDTMATLRKGAKVRPLAVLEPVQMDYVSDNPLNDRKEMWTELTPNK